MNDTNPYAPPAAAVADPDLAEQVPALWNPGAATAWSLLFTPVFGAILQMKNWQALGEPVQAARARTWAIGCAVYTVLVSLASIVVPASAIFDRFALVSDLALLLVWYFANGRAQIGHVRKRFGKTYLRRRWGVALSIGVSAFVAYLAIFTLASTAAMLARGEI
jgi:hypothetical protein